MAEPLGDLLRRLSIMSGPVETVYLNSDRAKETFIGELGAIDSFSRNASKAGRLDLPVVGAGGEIAGGMEVNWNLTDPVTQALVLRAALQANGSLYSPAVAEPGRYVRCIGPARLSRPDAMAADHDASLARWPGAYELLEQERADQESLRSMIDVDPARMWLLTVEDDATLAASILDGHWLSPSITSWALGGARFDLFARMRGRNQMGIALLASIHIMVSWT